MELELPHLLAGHHGEQALSGDQAFGAVHALRSLPFKTPFNNDRRCFDKSWQLHLIDPRDPKPCDVIRRP